MKAILVDLHGTLLNKETGKPIKIVVDAVKALSNKYHVMIFTADNLQDVAKAEQQIKSTGISYSGFYYQQNNLDDITKKLQIFNEISKTHKIELVIDNNKKVCKKFNSENIPVFRVII